MYNIKDVTLTVGKLKSLLNDFDDSDEVHLHSVVNKNEPFQFHDEGDYVLVDVPGSVSVSRLSPNGRTLTPGQCWIYSKGLLDY